MAANPNDGLVKKIAEMEKNEVRWECIDCDDAETIIPAYGTPARIALTALEVLRAQGVKAGLFRPITLWPFPKAALNKVADTAKKFDGMRNCNTVASSEGRNDDTIRPTGFTGAPNPSFERVSN